MPVQCADTQMSDPFFFNSFDHFVGTKCRYCVLMNMWYGEDVLRDCLSFPEYDGQLAPGGASDSGMASSSFLESNHNHSAASGCAVKSHSGIPGGPAVGTSSSAGGLERPTGSMDRVLKIFHYFETNSEPCTWASNIRHGDATDVRVGLINLS